MIRASILRPPELNPVENVSQFMRDNWLSNRVFASFDDIVDHCCDAWNKPDVREIVQAVVGLVAGGHGEVSQTDLKSVLVLDKSTISRRVAGALDGGFLKNLEDRKGRTARLVLRDPLPDDRDILPAPDVLISPAGLHGCVVVLGDVTLSAA